jgi:pimeloyl-ACP methyl ester carboxylesterase
MNQSPALRHGFVNANGIKIHTVSVGKGPLVLFLHGFPEFWYAWKEVLPEVAKAGFEAVAIDMRGYNTSDKPKELSAYRLPELIADIRDVVKAVGRGRKAILVAHDWGGAVAWSFAAAHPDLLERLVIVNAPHPTVFARELATNPKQQAASAYMTFFQSPGAEATLLKDNCAELVASILNSRKTGRPVSTEDRDAYIAAWTQPGALTGGLNYYRANQVAPPGPNSKAPSLGSLGSAGPVRVEVPTLVIWGMRDTALLSGNLDGLADYVKNLEIRRIEDGTHWVVHEKTLEIVSLVVDFASGKALKDVR